MEGYFEIGFIGILSLVFVIFTFKFLCSIKWIQENARKIEIIGYIILCIVAVWQYFIKEGMMGEFYNADTYYVNKKLDIIYNILLRPDSASDYVITWGDQKVDTFLSNELKMTNNIEIVLEVVSAFMIALGRFFDIDQEDKKLKKIRRKCKYKYPAIYNNVCKAESAEEATKMIVIFKIVNQKNNIEL